MYFHLLLGRRLEQHFGWLGLVHWRRECCGLGGLRSFGATVTREELCPLLGKRWQAAWVVKLLVDHLYLLRPGVKQRYTTSDVVLLSTYFLAGSAAGRCLTTLCMFQ